MKKIPSGLRSVLQGLLLLSLLAGLLAGANAGSLSAQVKAQAPALFQQIGRYAISGISEISAYDPGSRRLFTVGPDGLEIIDISDPYTPVQVKSIASLAGSNSVAVRDGLVAVAVEAPVKTDPGAVVFLDSDGNELNRVMVGVLPDMLIFTPDGSKILVANEGELGDLTATSQVDPEGSVSIIDLANGALNAVVTPVTFAAFNSKVEELRGQGVRIFPFTSLTTSVAQDLEPEYITISADGATAWVTLQENNAVAVLNIAQAKFTQILPLGYKDFSRGLPTLTTYPVTDLPVLGSTAPSAAYPQGQEIKLGGFSGLYYEGMSANGNLKFITNTDRGPNGEPTTFPAPVGLGRPFPLPDFQPELIRLELDPTTGNVSITERIGLKREDGVTPLTGRANLQAQAAGLAYTDEKPVDLFGQVLPNDPLGIDAEGIVVAADGSFWMVDEYRPAIYHFDAQGTLLKRYIPEGTAAAAGQPAGTFGAEVFPAVYAQRRANRGFEGIALEGNTVYAFIQSPIDNPDVANDANSRASRTLRILALDTVNETVTGEYLYLFNDPTASGDARTDKIGDAVAVGNGRFYVIERDDRTSYDSNKFVFELDLSGATNVHTPPALPAGRTLESLTADELAANGIRPVYKQKVTNLAAIGYTGISKPEGLALVNSNNLAVVNDNDFGVLAEAIAGDGTIPMRDTPEPILLGLVKFTQGNGLDPSDRDGASNGKAIKIGNWPVFGIFMPDSIASFSVNEETFLITANEGDDRADFLTIDERARISSLNLDPVVFPNAAALKANSALGRLRVTNLSGDLNQDGMYERLFTYGARSFTIWDASGDMVFDSGDLLEQITAAQTPELFNADSADPTEWDERSPAKGPEAESVTVGMVDGTLYAFVGLERAGGGAMIFDLTNPRQPVFVQYIRSSLDASPEGLLFIPAEKSPNGQALVILSHEFAKTNGLYSVTIYGGGQMTNLAPSVDAGGPYSVDEGGSVSLAATGSDPNRDPLTYEWDLDNNGTFEVSGQTVDFSAAEIDGPNSFTVKVKASDPGGLYAIDDTTIQVNNQPPVVSIPVVSPEPSIKGWTVLARANFNDSSPSDAPFTCTVDYGDGSKVKTGKIIGNTCYGPVHKYAAVGSFDVTVRVTDQDQETGVNSVKHSVVYGFEGFFQPVDNSPVVNVVKAGQAVPVKFSLYGYQGKNIFAEGYPKVEFTSCSADPVDQVEITVAVRKSTLVYDPANRMYIYNWKTEKSWAGNCGALLVKLNDGTTHTALFQFAR